MKLNKYSVSNNRNNSTVVSTSSSGGYGSNMANTEGSATIKRTLWGNTDDGTDLEEDIIVQGNMFCLDYGDLINDDDDNYDESFGDDDEDIDGDNNPDVDKALSRCESIFDIPDELTEEGGNLYVQNKAIIKRSLESPEIYASKTLYVPHPDTNVKTDIIELLKGYNTRITNNETNIANCRSHCSQNSTDIEALKKAIEELKKMIENGGGSGGGDSDDSNYTVTVRITSGVERIVLTGAISETVISTTTYTVPKGSQLSYTAYAKEGYTFGSATAATKVTTTSNSVIVNSKYTIEPAAIVWRGSGSSNLCPYCNSTLTPEECAERYGTDDSEVRQYPHKSSSEPIG